LGQHPGGVLQRNRAQLLELPPDEHPTGRRFSRNSVDQQQPGLHESALLTANQRIDHQTNQRRTENDQWLAQFLEPDNPIVTISSMILGTGCPSVGKDGPPTENDTGMAIATAAAGMPHAVRVTVHADRRSI
jgi:hypothetical protein